MHIARTLFRVSIVTGVLVVGAALGAVAVSQTAWFRDWLRGYVVAEAHQYLNGELTISRLSGDLFSAVQLEGVSITAEGQPVLSVDQISLEYSLLHLITSGVAVDQIRLTRPVVHLRHDEQGWSMSRLLKKQEQEADRQGPQSPIDLNAIVIQDGAIVIVDSGGISGLDLPERVDRLDATMSFHYAPVRYSLTIEGLSFRGSEPSLALTGLSGGIAVRDDTVYLDRLALRLDQSALSLNGTVEHYLTSPAFHINASSNVVAVAELAQLVPALRGLELSPAFELALDGPLDRLAVDLNVRSSAGGAVAQFVTDVQAPLRSVKGTMSVGHVNLAPLLNDAAQESDLTATIDVDLKGGDDFTDIGSWHGSASVKAPRFVASGYVVDRLSADARIAGREVAISGRASAYGVDATTAGAITIPGTGDPFGFDLTGRLRRVNLRQLPRSLNLPRVQTDVNADYHVAGSQALRVARNGTNLVANVTFAPSHVPGVAVVSGSSAGMTLQRSQLTYRADVSLTDLDLQDVGTAFEIPALADGRYASKIQGHVSIQGSGTALENLQLSAQGVLNDSTVAGGSIPSLSFTAAVDNRNARLTASGRIANVDPAVLSERSELKGRLGGDLTIDATIADLARGVTPESVTASVQVALEPSELGGLSITQGRLDADYREQTASIRTLEVAGPDLNLTAAGVLALNETGQSSLTFHFDSPHLETIGRLFEQPVSGIAAVDGTLTGNRTDLRVTGTLAGDGLQYQENGALSLEARYTLRIPDLTFANAIVQADSRATFVTVAGQEVNEVAAKVTYERQRLVFDVTAKQPQRSLDAAGALIVHPDHQEIHLERLNLNTAGQSWRVAPGQAPTIRYASKGIAVDDLRLVSGDQQLTARGTFGQPGDRLNVTLANIDLAGVDALLLRPPQFTGRLNAEAVLSGTREAPQVKGTFGITGGGFRQFTYETFAGTVDYGREGIELDTRLQQNAVQWIEAKGHLPMALLSGTGGQDIPEAGVHVEATRPSDRIDLTIDSSPLGLGLIQGFTPMLTDVDGTVEAHVRIVGSAADPHPTGEIAVADGVVTVAATGVTYSHIAGRIDLEPERVHIDQITVLDNHQSALSITGDLAVHGREVREGQLWVTAEDFKIVDNEIGDVRVQSAIELAGTLRAPQLRGDFGVSTGRVNLDELLALLGPSVYATEPIASADSDVPVDQRASPSLFDSLRMNVRLTIPDDLIIRASNLQTPGSTIGLGALNVTLGGDLTALKDPGEPMRLVGAVNTVRGTYDFQGRRFEILRDGQIRFEDDLGNPRLDLRTQRLISGVEANVNVRGHLRRPEIVLSSTPPLDQADILSLIVFNQPINQLGEGDQISLAQRAQSLAAGAVTGQIAQSIGNALNLDTFEIELAPVSGGGPEVTLGQQLGQNLYLKVQQGVGSQSTTNLIVEYELTKWLRLQTNVAQGMSSQQSAFRRRQGSGADLIVLFTR